MQSKIFAVVAGAAFAVASFGAEAMPTAGLDAGSTPHITLAAAGCGPGFVPGPGGGCRRRGRRAILLAPAPLVVVPRPRVVVAAPRARVLAVPRRVRPRCGVHVPGITVVTPC